MKLANKPEAKFAEVVDVLQRDPVLTARVLSIAQSALYASRTQTVSLHQAAVRLGLKALRDIVLEAVIQAKLFKAPGFDGLMTRLYRHSAAVAHVTRAVCRRTLVSAEYAFLCGLLHDMGIAAVLLLVAERPELRRLELEQLSPALDAVHADASGLLARQWKLPEALHRAVATHHLVVVDGKSQQVNAALVVAEQLCWEAGAGMLPPPEGAHATSDATPEPPTSGLDANRAERFQEARSALRLSDAALATARAEAFEIVGRLGVAEAA